MRARGVLLWVSFLSLALAGPGLDSVSAAVRYHVTNNGSSFDARFTIENTGAGRIFWWGIAFNWTRAITSLSGAVKDSLAGGRYWLTNAGWNSTIDAGDSVVFHCYGSGGDTTALPSNIVVSGFDPEVPPDWPRDELAVSYRTVRETDTTFTGLAMLENPNPGYAWNGSCFDVRNIGFRTSSSVTAITTPDGAVSFGHDGSRYVVELGWQSIFPPGEKVCLTLTGRKQGASPVPDSFTTRYVRGDDIRYPVYGTLPASWYPGKPDLVAADLVADPGAYYNTAAPPVTGKLIVYEPGSATQVQIGQVDSLPFPVNSTDAVRMWVPGRLAAMGMGAAYELYKVNPDYMCGLGTKENWAAGVIAHDWGGHNTPVVIDGDTWYWPLVAHVDGPYQQIAANFDDCKLVFPDLLPPGANHDDYTSITPDTGNDHWVTSTLASAISNTVTREFLCAIPVRYNAFMDSCRDPWAEMECITYAWNRGLGAFLAKGILTTYRDSALASTDLVADFDMAGNGEHVPTVRAITAQMNGDVHDIYDDWLTWSDFEVFFSRLRMFYGRGVPGDSAWAAMTADVARAFNVLARHWGGSHVSYRYDFLTLLRVAKAYLPQPYNPRPTGESWYYRVINCPGVAVAETPSAEVRTPSRGSLIVRGVLNLQSTICNLQSEFVLLDVSGRNVLALHPGPNDVSRLPAGTYFVRTSEPKTIRLIIVR